MGDPVITQLFYAQLPSSISPSILKVSVVPNLDGTLEGLINELSWSPVPGAIKYYVYASPSPITREFYAETTATTLIHYPEFAVPPDTVFHYWVEADLGNNVKQFIQDEPVFLEENSAFDTTVLSAESQEYILDEGDMKYKIEEIRRRHKAILENDAEPFQLYVRRWLGTPCQHIVEGAGNNGDGAGMPIDSSSGDPFANTVTTKDPDYNYNYECEDCFGTGIYGGYYKKIDILCRYGDIPQRTIKFMSGGLNVSQDYNSWTLWFPRLHEHDILVRTRTGERFKVQGVGHSAWRGIPMQQRFTAQSVPPTDIIYHISNTKIDTAIDKTIVFDNGVYDWARFDHD
jgi:hypothetical protein